MSAAENVTRLGARGNVDNIVHMLHVLADELGAGIEPMPRHILLIAVDDPSEKPRIYQFGEEPSRMEALGALAVAGKILMGESR